MSEKLRIRNFIFENFVFGVDEAELDDGTSFLETGIIDSTGVLEIVGFLEEEYGFAVQDDEVLPENFDSINNLASYVERKLAGVRACEPAQVSGQGANQSEP